MKNTVIIGNGISGITLARHLRKQAYTGNIVVISDETPYFFSRTALMYVYMGHMPFENTKPYEDWFWKKNKIDLVFARVQTVDFSTRTLHLNNNSTLTYDNLVFAVGSKPNFFNTHHDNVKGVQGLFSYQDLQLMEENTKNCKHAVVAGGGLIGVEMVEMLLSRDIPVTYLVREFKFWNKVLPNEEADMIGAHIKEHGVDLRLGNEIHDIKYDANNRVRSIVVHNNEEINCDFAGICIGVSPNIGFIQNTALKTDRGILVNTFFETNIEHVYAIGDCAQFSTTLPGRTTLEQIWYTGRMHGETLAKTIAGKKTAYKPGNFFNSAKLFDVEYQVYTRNVILPDNIESVVYINHDAKKSMRIFYNMKNGTFEGITLLGIRYRHEVCDRWLNENRSVEYVLEHLCDANFDPEFSTQYEQLLVNQYNTKHQTNITLKQKSWKRILGIHT